MHLTSNPIREFAPSKNQVPDFFRQASLKRAKKKPGKTRVGINRLSKPSWPDKTIRSNDFLFCAISNWAKIAN
jgi:hypothetical protein